MVQPVPLNLHQEQEIKPVETHGGWRGWNFHSGAGEAGDSLKRMSSSAGVLRQGGILGQGEGERGCSLHPYGRPVGWRASSQVSVIPSFIMHDRRIITHKPYSSSLQAERLMLGGCTRCPLSTLVAIVTNTLRYHGRGWRPSGRHRNQSIPARPWKQKYSRTGKTSHGSNL